MCGTDWKYNSQRVTRLAPAQVLPVPRGRHIIAQTSPAGEQEFDSRRELGIGVGIQRS